MYHTLRAGQSNFDIAFNIIRNRMRLGLLLDPDGGVAAFSRSPKPFDEMIRHEARKSQ